QEQHVDAVHSKPLQAAFEDRAQRRRLIDVWRRDAGVVRTDGGGSGCLRTGYEQVDLGADLHEVADAEGGDDATEVRLGEAVTVVRRGVEVGDACVEGARDDLALLARVALVHEPARGAAAEAERRNCLAAGAERTPLHASPLRWPPSRQTMLA